MGQPIMQGENQEDYLLFAERATDGLFFVISKERLANRQALLLIVKTNIKEKDEKKNIVANIMVSKKKLKKEAQ